MRKLILWKLIAMFALAAGLGMAASPKILVHGHRGARAVLPENSMAAFEYAIEKGVDVLELDLAVTRDNVLVVSHDARINPEICSGPRPRVAIRELTLAELREYDCGAKGNSHFPRQKAVPGTRIPTLEEVLALAPKGTFEFNIETKISPKTPELAPSPEEFARLLLLAIRRHNLESRVIVQSFDFRTLHVFASLAPNIRRSALFSEKDRDFVATAREANAQIVSPNLALVTFAQVEAAHRAGLQVVPWTANTPEEWDRLIPTKVDAIISDDPAALISYLKR
jgi:glycerophosphoryl diester phosphodiesterase